MWEEFVKKIKSKNVCRFGKLVDMDAEILRGISSVEKGREKIHTTLISLINIIKY